MIKKIEQKTWILLNAIKGDSVAYLPWVGEWFARGSKSRISKPDFMVLQNSGYVETRSAEVLIADITPAGIEAWEMVPDGIEQIEGTCDECSEVKNLRPLYSKSDGRFIYLCSDCRSRDFGREWDGMRRAD